MKKWNIILPPKTNKQLQLPKVIQDITFEALENLEAEGATPNIGMSKKLIIMNIALELIIVIACAIEWKKKN